MSAWDTDGPSITGPAFRGAKPPPPLVVKPPKPPQPSAKRKKYIRARKAK